jgi:iron complex outermembrane recepter protein
MKKIYLIIVLQILFLAATGQALAQTTISGTIKDGGTGETLAGVNVVVRGRVTGTISDINGKYNLKVNQAPPFTLSFSFIGFKSQEIEVKDANATIDLTMEEQTLLGQEVVVSASRVEESILKSPVTIEKMDGLAIKQAATPDFYDALANMKGVQVNNGSLNFTAVNTRGFATIANVRFVQWVDGMDTQAPLLNFPTGSIMGLSELDAESIELIPGAASALYGPNAFNGIMIMKSKSPFEYQGLSAQVKQGVTTSNAGGSHPLGQYAFRYAKAFNNKLAFKVNFSYLAATDWLSNDYKTDRNNPESTTNLSKTPNFDGLNLYGDETQINTGIPSVGNNGVITRTGFREQDILNNRNATTIKGDAALHYRVTDKVEAILAYRYGGGNSIYQGTEKYALRNFNQQFFKAEVKGDNFFVRGYLSATDAGKSYNLSALGAYANETYSPSATSWVPDYVLAMQGYAPGVAAGNNDAARAYADRNRPQPGTQAFTNLMSLVRSNFFQKTPTGTWTDANGVAHQAAGGASFYDNSKLWHAEFNKNFSKEIKWADIMIGGNFRQYSLFSNGTIFNEFGKRIFINQVGVYTQISKTVLEHLKLTGSIRYDKSDNFDGHFTPRISTVYTFNENHNIRASFQTGFRIPDTQAQFIYFPSSSGILLGSVAKNGSQYGIFNGGSYTQDSYNAYVQSGGKLDPNTGATIGGNSGLLQTANFGFLKPEKLQAFEIGYKGVIAQDLLLDLNYYYTSYSGFIGSLIVASKNHTTTDIETAQQTTAGTLYSPYVNATNSVTSHGIGLGLTYSLPRNFTLNGNYNYATYHASDESNGFIAGFNTPQNRFSIGLANRKLVKNVGFNVNYRWQEMFQWQSSYGQWNVPAYGVVDAQITYKTPLKVVFKVGGTNIGGGDYRTNLGAPFVGQQYYVSVTFDEFLK